MYNQENIYYDDYSGMPVDDFRNAAYPKAMPFIMKGNNEVMNNFDNNMFGSTFMKPSYKDDKVTDPQTGLLTGNLFPNLYQQYQNYQPVPVRPNSEREALLLPVQQYDFALNDLGLYLDLHPNNRELLNLYNKYLQEYKKAVNNFEQKFGPLCRDSVVAATNTWNYDESPWPWEVQK